MELPAFGLAGRFRMFLTSFRFHITLPCREYAHAVQRRLLYDAVSPTLRELYEPCADPTPALSSHDHPWRSGDDDESGAHDHDAHCGA